MLIITGVYMLTPTIPLYIASLGAAESHVGIVATIFLVASIITRMFINTILNQTGKKLTLIAGVLLNTVVLFLYGFTHSLGATAILRAIQGIGFGITTTITATMAVDFLPDSRRGEGIGYFSMGVVLGSTIGPAISLFLMRNFGFQPMFFVASGFSLITAITVMFSEEPAVASVSKPENKVKATFKWQNIFDRKLILPAAFIVLIGIARSADSNYISLFAEERNFDHLTLYFPISAMTMFFIRFIIGRFSDRKGRNWVLIPGGFAMLAMLITLSLAKTSGVMLLGAFLNGLGMGVLAPGMQLWMFDCVEASRRSVASAAYFNFTDLGVGAGAFSMGFLAENAGYTVMFQTAAGVALLAIVLYAIIGREKAKKPEL